MPSAADTSLDSGAGGAGNGNEEPPITEVIEQKEDEEKASALAHAS